MNAPSTAVLNIDKITVEDGVNPRTRFDEDRLAELEASISQDGLVSALTVVPAKGDRYTLIAGERRLIAARRAGLKEVPVVIRQAKGSKVATLVENVVREDLDPIDLANGIADLAEAENLTHQQVAERLGKKRSASWVSEHFRLLNLPAGVQRYIAEGVVPVNGERCLREVAKVSPRVAECVCELAKRRKVKASQFVSSFGELLAETAEARFEDKPMMIGLRAVPLGSVVTDAKKRRELSERFHASRPHGPEGEPVISFGEAAIDAARAAGCLVEHRVDRGEFVSYVRFITDAAFAADLAERAVERVEAEAAERAKREEASGGRRNGGDPGATSEADKEARRAQREEAKARKEEARRRNGELERKLLQRRGGASRKEHALARAKALVAIVLADNPKLAARGLRLATSQLQDVEVKQLKTSGETREKVSYADAEQCMEYMRGRIEEARTVNEVLELAGDAVIASLLADEEELPQSKRVWGGLGAQDEVEKLLAADIKSVRPRRSRRKSGK